MKTKNWDASLPGDRILFLTLDEALAIHDAIIERFGGSAGVRDLGLLESALYRPQTGYYSDLIEMTAALMESLLMNHPFADGNKPTAFFAADVFLRLNGWKLEVEQNAAHAFIIGLLESGSADLQTLINWLRERAKTIG